MSDGKTVKIVMCARQQVTYEYSVVLEVPEAWVDQHPDAPELLDVAKSGVNKGLENPLHTGACMNTLPMARQWIEDNFIDCRCTWPEAYEHDHRYTLRLTEDDMAKLPCFDRMTLKHHFDIGGKLIQDKAE